MVIEKPFIQLSMDDHEIVELLGHYDGEMLHNRLRTLMSFICDCTMTQEAEIFVRSHDIAEQVLIMMN